MSRFLLSQLRHSRGRAAALGAGILVAAVSFVLLTSAVSTSALEVRGAVATNWKTAYDILVRPPNSFTRLEQERGLVADNYLSGIFGGITLDQWHKVLSIAGVDVAAPIANVGFVAPYALVDVPINDAVNWDAVQLYRLRTKWIADRGLSTYAGDTGYIYFTRAHRMQQGAAGYGPDEVVGTGGKPLEVCASFNKRLDVVQPTSPFDHSERTSAELQCFSSRSPKAAQDNVIAFPPGRIGWKTAGNYPILVSAIDPVQEQALIGLDRTIASGRTLKEQEGPTLQPLPGNSSFRVRTVPVIASTRVYVDQVLHVSVERLTVPRGADVPATLASSAAFRFLTRLPGRPVATKRFEPGPIYQDLLDRFEMPEPATSWYWTTSPVRYDVLGPDRLRPLSADNPVEVWENPSLGGLPAAPGNDDVQYRLLHRHAAINLSLNQGNTAPFPALQVVGRFDAAKLPGFSPASQVPLETYYPPQVEPADVGSRAALGSKPLLPTMNLGDYIAAPPMMLTTLEGARVLLDSKRFEATNPQAPISVIRVRVAGVTGPDPVSRERVRRVAQAIREKTGLAVDITAGSSPHPLLVDLSPGRFGRPALTVREGWTKKGVAFAIVSALDRKSLTLFVLVLVVSGLFLANGAFASVRSRRTEIGTLLCLGWGRGRIFRAVLGELALVGLASGLVGTGLAFLLVRALSLDMAPLGALLVTPVAVALACLAGLVPAWRAARSVPLDAVRPPVAAPRRARPIRGLAQMAAANLLRLPGRTLLGAGALLVGVAALAFLLSVNLAFRGTLVGSLLGQIISVQVRAVDYMSVALAIALGGLSVADVLVLNLKERAPELVTLRTTGWAERHLARLVVMEGVGIGLVGALLGAGVGLVLGVALGEPVGPVVSATVLAAAAGVAVAALASLVPALLTPRLTPPAVLAEE